MRQIDKNAVFAIKLLTIALFLSSGLSGCTCRKKENLTLRAGITGQFQRIIPDSVPAYKIILARGGGFTALWSGYTLYPDGRVENWQRFGAQADSVVWTGQAEAQRIKQFNQEFKNSGIMGQEILHQGNLSQSLSYVTPDTTLVWTWTNEDEELLHLEFKKWYAQVREFCARLRNTQP